MPHLSVEFAKEEKFEVTIQRVRELSEGKLHRDPDARVIPAPQPCRPVIFRVQQPPVRGSIKFQKWCMRKAEQMNMSMDTFKKWRSAQMSARYHAKKKWSTV